MRTSCPRCAQMLEVEDQHVGQQVQCPACRQVFQAQGGPGGAPSATPWAGGASPAGGMGYTTPAYPVPPELWPYVQGLDDRQVALAVAAYHARKKDSTVFILLAVLTGSLGIHWFYVGDNNRGLIYLLVCVLTCGLGGIVTHILGIVEAIQHRQHLDPLNAVAAQQAVAEVRAFAGARPSTF